MDATSFNLSRDISSWKQLQGQEESSNSKAMEVDSSASSGNVVGDGIQSFGDILKNSIGQVDQLQAEAEKATQTYAVGGNIELHQVMIAVEKAELSMELATQVRNKMVAVYQEISRMGV